jgi:hypothetical protein
MAFPFAVPVLAAVLLVADGPPTFNVEPGCRRAAERSGPGANADICVRKEQEAREQMAREWPQFTAADQVQCVSLSTRGGTPTYTELLTCLEMAKESRALRAKGDPLFMPVNPGATGSTTGSGSTGSGTTGSGGGQ